MNKRVLTILLALVMVVSLVAVGNIATPAEAATYANATQQHHHTDHSGSDWQAWEDPTSLPTSGKIYLNVDEVVMTARIGELTGDLTICLNGKKISSTDSGTFQLLRAHNNYDLTICDCTAKTENGVYTAGTIDGTNACTANGGIISCYRGSTLYLYDGILTGASTSGHGGAVYIQAVSGSAAGGTFNMYGGQISGNQTTAGTSVSCGAGVWIGGGSASVTGGTFNMYGGSIINNVSKYDAGAVHVNSGANFNIYGGTITGNTAKRMGGAIYDGGNITLSGTVTISDNTATDVGVNNLDMTSAAALLNVTGLNADSFIGLRRTANANLTAAVTDASLVRCFFYDDDAGRTNAAIVRDASSGGLKVVANGHSHTLCGETGCDHANCASETVFKPWGRTAAERSKLPVSSDGAVFLVADINIPSSSTARGISGDVQWCLNGFDVSYSKASATTTTQKHLNINAGGIVAICDCTASGEGDTYTAGQITGAYVNGNGGSITVARGGTLYLYDGKITGNKTQSTDQHGGAVYMQGATSAGNGGVFYMYGGEISHNQGHNGGAVWIGGASSTYTPARFYMYGGIIKNNKANSNGGAIRVEANTSTAYTDPQVIISGGIIKDNDANGGGAISNYGKIEITGSAVISGNEATGNGGAINVGRKATVILSGGTISGNTSNGADGGGAFYLQQGNASEGKGAVLQMSGGTIKGNTAKAKGGAVFVSTTASTSVDPAKFIMTGGTIGGTTEADANTASEGGAIQVAGIVELSNGSIIGNQATGTNGGAIRGAGTATISLTNMILSGNQAVNQGGAIYCAGSTVTVTGGSMTGNEAREGAAISAYGGSLTLDGVTVQSNTTEDTGAIYVAKSGSYGEITVTLKGKTVITDNKKADGTLCNFELPYNDQYTVLEASQLSEGASVGVSLDNDRHLNGQTTFTGASCSESYFTSDVAGYTILANDIAELRLAHYHCLCGGYGAGCDHTPIEWKAWDGKDADADTSGFQMPGENVYLLNDAALTDRADLTCALCLNGHDVTPAEGKQIFRVDANAVASISDCTATIIEGVYTAGKLTGANNTANGAAIAVYRNGDLTIYDGIITGNTTTADGGAIYLQRATTADGGKLSLYGGWIYGNQSGTSAETNTGGAVWVGTKSETNAAASLTVGGDVVIENNTATLDGETFQRNVFLEGQIPVIIVDGLVPGASIGVTVGNIGDGRVFAQPATEGDLQYFVSDVDSRIFEYSENALRVAQYLAIVNGKYYTSVSDAIAASSATNVAQLLRDVENVYLRDGIGYLDLNGYTITNLHDGGSLYGMDTETNDYDCENGVGYGKIVNILDGAEVQLTSYLGGRRYVAITVEGEGTSFHRFYASITTMSLHPSDDGIGYIMEVRGDQMAIAYMDEDDAFGLTITLNDGTDDLGSTSRNGVRADVTNTGFTSKQVLVYGVLKAGNTAEEKNTYGNYKIKAMPYVMFGGQKVDLAGRNYSYRDMVEKTDAAIDVETAQSNSALMSGLKALVNKYGLREMVETYGWKANNMVGLIPEESAEV